MITVRVSQKESECYQKCDLNLPTAPARDSDLTEPAGENNRDRQSGREREETPAPAPPEDRASVREVNIKFISV